jgi:hypothetical protein
MAHPGSQCAHTTKREPFSLSGIVLPSASSGPGRRKHPKTIPSATRAARDPRAFCHRAPAGGDQAGRLPHHGARQRDGRTAQEFFPSLCIPGEGPSLADDHPDSRVLTSPLSWRSALRLGGPRPSRRPLEIILLPGPPVNVPLRRHLVAAGVDEFPLAALGHQAAPSLAGSNDRAQRNSKR